MKYALRSLARSPGFTTIAVLTLALGIGATTTVFSWIERVLLNPLPGVRDVSRVIALESISRSGEPIDSSFLDIRDYQAQAKTLSGVLVYKERPLNLGTGAEAERVWGQLVSGSFFETLQVRPRLGRFFSAGDRPDESAATPVVVISERLWRRHFNADPAVLGRTLKLNEHVYTVIGVAPGAFLGSLNGLVFDVWVPIGTHALLLGPSNWLESRGARSLHTLARLAPGATLEAAQAELAGLAAQLAQAYPNTNRGIGFSAVTIARSKDGAQSLLAKPLFVLLGVTGLVLLIVCANLSNLQLVRASARQREMCIRQAIGAGAWRIVRQLLGESLLLSLAGTLVGLLFTLWMSDLLRQFIPDATLPISLTAQISPPVLAAAALLSIGTTLLAGLAPALWIARLNLIGVLRASSRAATITPRAEFFRRALVVLQVALALVTLACAALATKSLLVAKNANPGFDPHGVLLAGLKLDTLGYTEEQALIFLQRLQQRLATFPDVASSALAERVPLDLSRGSWEEVNVTGYVPAPNEDLRIYRNLVSPGYFAHMRIPLLAGREFTAADRRDTQPVAVVSEAFARRFFGDAEALGRTFSIWRGKPVLLTVVGVVRNITVDHFGETPQPYFYVPVQQFFRTDTGLAIQLRAASPLAQADPMTLLPALRATLREIDPRVPVFEALSLDDFIGSARFAQRTAASLLTVLSIISLALTALGLYGVLAFAVVQRTPEIGVRLALGAEPRDISRLFIRRGAMLLALGLPVGVVAALVVTRGLASVFYGLSAFEPALLACAIAPVVVSALAACWLPAQRAARVDPVVALRAE